MFHHLAGGLREAGIDARVLHSEYSTKGPVFKKVTFEFEEAVPTWRTTQFFPPKGNTFIMKVWIRKYVNDILAYIQKEGKPDLIHAHSYLAASVCAVSSTHLTLPTSDQVKISGVAA